MKLLELLKSVYKYKLKWDKHDRHVQAEFKTDQGHAVLIDFMYQFRKTTKYWEIEFGRFETQEDEYDSDIGFGINNKGDAFKILSTVLDAINEFIYQAEEPEWIMFSAEEASRRKLYNTMAKRFGNNKYLRVTSGKYYDYIRDGYESEVFLFRHRSKVGT